MRVHPVLASFIVKADAFSPERLASLAHSLRFQPQPSWECVFLISPTAEAQRAQAHALTRLDARFSCVDVDQAPCSPVEAWPWAEAQIQGHFAAWIAFSGWVAQETLQHLVHLDRRLPSLCLIASDEDKIDPLGQRSPACLRRSLSGEALLALCWAEGESLVFLRKDQWAQACTSLTAFRFPDGEGATWAHVPRVLYHRWQAGVSCAVV